MERVSEKKDEREGSAVPENKKGFVSALHIRGLRERWLFSAALPILLLLVLAVALFSIGVQEYYYSAMRSGLESRARIAAETFSGYGVKSYSEYYRLASYSAETFEEKDTIELQFINTNGRVQVSSYGLTAGTLPGTSDIDAAVGGEMASYQGRDPQTGENILAVSYPLYFNSRVVGVLRYVTSLREAQHRVLMDSLLASAAALVCMVLIAASNAIFINNVVEPVAVVSDAARRISGGSYGIMIENRYRDELGELVDNINDMSMKISQAEKIQQEFISSVSHELRTPLTAISGWAETLSVDPGSNLDQTKRGLGIILKESRRLTTMVEELLEFTKMQDGRFTLRVESVDLAGELEDAVYTYFELFRQEGIEVCYTGPDDDIPPVVADSERMKQVFCNVLDNAAKHGGSGKRIDVSAAREGNSFVIRVRDYGPGIPEAELPFVKQKFYKGSSKARGSGIGLAVCDEIVRLHGGTFDIANADGGGAVVTIALPIP
jgi:two-component system OmpR family sensor kinase